MEKKFNVYIMAKGGEAQALIGENMSEERAERRVMTGLTRIDRENFFVANFEVGKDGDKQAKKDLIKNKQ